VICVAEGYATAASVHEATGLPVVVTLSLSELLRLPERKAETWRDIQPLRIEPNNG
jgi:phage/plasmid primase-like uncharacterized protein